MRRSTMQRPPTITTPRRGNGTGCCARPITPTITRSAGYAATARSGGAATPSISARRSPASRSASKSAPTAPGACATGRSNSATSSIAARASNNPRNRPVDLWITLTGYPQVHRLSRYKKANDTHEQNKKTVTYVAGLKCYLCSRLLILPVLGPVALVGRHHRGDRQRLQRRFLAFHRSIADGDQHLA